MGTQIGEDLLHGHRISVVTPEDPNSVTGVDEPAREALHGADVTGVDVLGHLAVVVAAVICHHADADRAGVAAAARR